MPIGKQTNIFTFCGFAVGWFYHVWLIDRVRMMKRPPMQKYEKDGTPICASYADSQSCSSAACAADLSAVRTARLLQLECIGRLMGQTHPIRPLIQTTAS